LLSLKRPSFYSFCEEEEECYQSVTRWQADDKRMTSGWRADSTS
jgi:hypothetical protein